MRIHATAIHFLLDFIQERALNLQAMTGTLKSRGGSLSLSVCSCLSKAFIGLVSHYIHKMSLHLWGLVRLKSGVHDV